MPKSQPAVDDDLDLGLVGMTTAYSTSRDIRNTLELKSTDPEVSAFELLIRPNRPHLRLDEARRRLLGRIALERFCATSSTCAADFADLLEHVTDDLTFEWRPGEPFAPVPVGKRS